MDNQEYHRLIAHLEIACDYLAEQDGLEGLAGAVAVAMKELGKARRETDRRRD